MTLIALSIAAFCLLGKDDWNKVQWDFFGHVMPVLNHMTVIASATPPLHLLVPDDQNGMHNDFFSHLTLLALASASCDVSGIVNNTIAFLGQDN